jgi:hypothetical protein
VIHPRNWKEAIMDGEAGSILGLMRPPNVLALFLVHEPFEQIRDVVPLSIYFDEGVS